MITHKTYRTNKNEWVMPADVALIDGKLISKIKTLIIEGQQKKCQNLKKMLSSLKKLDSFGIDATRILWYQTRRPIASWSGLMRAYKVLKIC